VLRKYAVIMQSQDTAVTGPVFNFQVDQDLLLTILTF